MVFLGNAVCAIESIVAVAARCIAIQVMMPNITVVTALHCLQRHSSEQWLHGEHLQYVRLNSDNPTENLLFKHAVSRSATSGSNYSFQMLSPSLSCSNSVM